MIERLYGTATSIRLPLIAWSLTSFHNSLTTTMFAAGDFKIALDDADFTNTATLPSICPGGRDLVLSLTAAEISARKITIQIVDQTNPKVWEDQSVLIETYGTSSAMHAFNRNQTTVQASLTAAQTGVTIATVTDVTNTVKASLTAAQAGVTIATVADVTNGVKLTSTAILSNLGASATAQINAEVDTALSDLSVTANVMNRIMTHLDVTVSSRSTFDAAATAVTTTVAIPSQTTTAQAVWNMTQSAFTTAGTFGDLLDATSSGISGGGGGGTDWSDSERAYIRHALGVPGSVTTSTGGVLQSISSRVTTLLDVTVSSRSTFDATVNGVSLTANQAGVTLANVTTVVTVNNFGASAATQIQSGAAAALAAVSVTANVQNRIMTHLDATVSSRSTFDPAASGVSLTAVQAGVTIATVSNVTGGVNLTSTAVLNNLGASATAQVNAQADLALADVSVTANVMNRIISHLDATVSSRSTFDASVTGVKVAVGGITATSFAAGAIDAAALATDAANEIADAYLDRADAIETSWSPRMSQRVILAAAAGKLSGASTTTVAIRNVGDTKTRISATVDSSGNRTAVTLDGA